MLKRTFHWQFPLEDGYHQVTLTVDLFRRAVQIDEAVPVSYWKSLKERHRTYPFDLGNHHGEINTREGPFFMYKASLCLDEVWLPGEHETRASQQARPDLYYLRSRIFLEDLAHRIDLKLVVLPPDESLLERVLVGTFNGFLSCVRVEQDSEEIPYYLILIRYESLQDTKMLQKELSRALRQIPFIRNRYIRYAPRAMDDLVILNCYFSTDLNFKNELQRHLETITTILAKYGCPTDPARCEKDNCKDRSSGKPDLILVNKFPVRWCPDCLNTFREQIKDQAHAYQKSPSGLRQGGIASLLTMISASLIVSVSMNMGTYIAVFSMMMPILAIAALFPFFEHSMLKLSRRLFLISAASIAAISPVGTYLALMQRILRNPDLLKDNGILLHPWSYLGKEWGMMWFVAPWSLIIVLVLQHRIWRRHREMLENKYHPQIAIVKD